MHLNTLQPAAGSKHNSKRLGRGIGSGKGKTSGHGHKGQKARSGGYHGKNRVGFEGGQMPLKQRVPKFGFASRKAMVTAQIRLSELNKIDADRIDLDALKKAGIIRHDMKVAKVFASGEIKVAKTIAGIKVTKGAKAAIEAAGGKIEE